MIILVINCGSSSIKYQLLDMKSDDVYELLAKGIVEKIGLPEGRLTHKPTGKEHIFIMSMDRTGESEGQYSKISKMYLPYNPARALRCYVSRPR